MLNKIKEVMAKRKNKQKKDDKPKIQVKDNNGIIKTKYIEDLDDKSKIALMRLDELGKEKAQIMKRTEELDVVSKYYTNQVEKDVLNGTGDEKGN